MNSIRDYISKKGLAASLLTAYMLLQPVIDILTSLGVRAGMSVTFGIVFRMLFLAAAGCYLLFFHKSSRRRLFVIYTLVLAAYCAVYLAFQIYAGGLGTLMLNVKGLIKVVYFPLMSAAICALWCENRQTVSLRTLYTVTMLYIAVIIAAMLTGTSFVAYEHSLHGYCGWFYAANEIGAIVACTLPLVIFFAGKRKGWDRAAPLLIAALIASYIGTKVVFAVVLCYAVLYTLWSIVASIITHGKREYVTGSAVGALVCLAAVLIFTNSPLASNLNTDFLWRREIRMEYTYDKVVEIPGDAAGDAAEEVVVTVIPSKLWRVANWLLSERLADLENYINEMRGTGAAGRLLGIGYAGIVEENSLEMDLFAVFFQHGLIGFVLLLAPLLLMLIWLIVYLFRHFKHFFTSLELCTYMYSFLALTVVGAFTGHTYVAPAVSIYLPLIFARFLAVSQEPEKLEEKNEC